MDWFKLDGKIVVEYVVDFFEWCEVKYIFGFCGYMNIVVFVVLVESFIDFVMVCYEQIGSYVVDVYVCVQGRVFVVLSYFSLGLINCVIGVVNVVFDCVFMVVIVGDIFMYYYGKYLY